MVIIKFSWNYELQLNWFLWSIFVIWMTSFSFWRLWYLFFINKFSFSLPWARNRTRTRTLAWVRFRIFLFVWDTFLYFSHLQFHLPSTLFFSFFWSLSHLFKFFSFWLFLTEMRSIIRKVFFLIITVRNKRISFCFYNLLLFVKQIRIGDNFSILISLSSCLSLLWRVLPQR